MGEWKVIDFEVRNCPSALTVLLHVWRQGWVNMTPRTIVALSDLIREYLTMEVDATVVSLYVPRYAP
jgi:hypothetical protein